MRRHVDDHELLLSLDHELPPQRHSDVSQHLDVCGVCRERADRLRTALVQLETLYREQDEETPPSADGRMRLASAMREAASYEQPWIQRVSESLEGAAFARGLAVALVVMAACIGLVAVRRTTAPTVGTVAWNALPESSLTPGAVAELTAAELCNGVRPSRLVTETVREQVVRAYRMERVPAGAYELDALITPELGGSTEPANLWPQRYQSPMWNAHVKDALERLLPEMVCSQQISLAEAQQALASNWVAAYKRYFKTDAPIGAHLGPPKDEDAELLVVPDGPTMQVVTRIVSR